METMYQAMFFSINHPSEYNYKAYFSSRQKAVDWCREKEGMLDACIKSNPRAHYYIAVREWVDSEGRLIPRAYHEYKWYDGERHSLADSDLFFLTF